MPSTFPLQVRQHEADRPCGAGRGRDQVDRRSACTPKILVRQIEDRLVVRVRVNRRHEPVLDPEGVVEHLRHRCDAVRRARRIRDDRVPLRVVGLVVDAEHERDVRIGRRRRDQDLLRARIEVLLRTVALGEEPVDSSTTSTPSSRHGSARRVALREPAERAAADLQRVAVDRDRLRKPPEHRVVPAGDAPSSSTSPRSLKATISKSPPRSSAARRKLRPIRPNPLIPTRVFAIRRLYLRDGIRSAMP